MRLVLRGSVYEFEFPMFDADGKALAPCLQNTLQVRRAFMTV